MSIVDAAHTVLLGIGVVASLVALITSALAMLAALVSTKRKWQARVTVGLAGFGLATVAVWVLSRNLELLGWT